MLNFDSLCPQNRMNTISRNFSKNRESRLVSFWYIFFSSCILSTCLKFFEISHTITVKREVDFLSLSWNIFVFNTIISRPTLSKFQTIWIKIMYCLAYQWPWFWLKHFFPPHSIGLFKLVSKSHFYNWLESDKIVNHYIFSKL